MTDQPAPGMGHNEPPTAAEQLRARLKDDYGENQDRADELLAGVETMPATIDDDEEEKKATSFAKQLNDAVRLNEAQRKREKDPFKIAGQTVDAYFKAISAPIGEQFIIVKARIDAYKRLKESRERERLRVEAEKRKREADEAAAVAQAELDKAAALESQQLAEAQAAEAIGETPLSDLDRPIEESTAVATAAALRADDNRETAEATVHEAVKAAEAPAADLTRARGPYGGVSTQRELWTFRSLDRAKVDLSALRPHLRTDDIEHALRQYIAAGGRQIAGAVIYETTRTEVR